MSRASERSAPDTAQRSLALGFLAILPLLVAHEWGARARGYQMVNFGEVVLGLPFAALGPRAENVRWALLALCALASAVSLYRAEFALLPRLGWILAEGALAAVAIGPLLVFLAWLLEFPGDPSHLRTGAPLAAPPLSLAAVVCGGAAFEEIVFRLGVLSLLYLGVRRTLLALGAGSASATLLAEVLALAGSSLVFALSHLAPVVELVAGPGGEAFDAAIFSWRVLAGMLLGILFRWRGMGVAAWAHALFNLALILGAGPDVFL